MERKLIYLLQFRAKLNLIKLTVFSGFKAFFKQRKRWGPSTMANILDLLLDTRIVTKNNSSISKLYMVYQFFLFVTSVLTPGTIFLMILGATKLAYPTINLTFLLVANLVPVVLFVLACLFGKSEFQVCLFSPYVNYSCIYHQNLS